MSIKKEITIETMQDFFVWLDKQEKDYFCGEFLYDVKGYYKRMKLNEMFDYWIERVH